MKKIIIMMIVISIVIGVIYGIIGTIVINSTSSETEEEGYKNTDNNSNQRIIIHDGEPIILENIIISLYHSVFEWQKYSGDFKEEQLLFLYNQCNKYEIPMELMLSIICTESGFRSDAKAKTSSASGYCQIIKSTAKWIYEDKLNYGTYDIDNHVEIMTSNWRLNIEISCRLMYSLYYNNGKTWENAVKKYYGSTNEAANITYLNKVNQNMIDLFNIEISDLT